VDERADFGFQLDMHGMGGFDWEVVSRHKCLGVRWRSGCRAV